MRSKRVFFVLLIPALFFIICLLSISHYGISWDSPIHFQRGQAYLHYFMTGETNYKSLPIIKDYTPRIEGLDVSKEFPGRKIISNDTEQKRSYFQNESFDAKYFIEGDSGHPPLNGILAALSNKIFYQKLGIMGDIESYHLFIILSATLLVFVVSAFAYQTYGFFVALVSGISLSLYPLFFSESHFNIKDPPEAAFFGLTIWSFWVSLNRKSWRWLLLSVISFSLALGTKFNILFLPFIVLPYLLVRYFEHITEFFKKPFVVLKRIPFSYSLMLLVSPLIVSIIFFGTWPYLWQDFWSNTLSIFKFYKDIGTASSYQPGFILPDGFNFYPVYWIIVTTPIWMLLLTFLGIIFSIKNIKKNNYLSLLWLLWFFVPILRVSMPGTSVYGGIRQIMEYIPAMSILSGLGAYFLVQILSSLKILKKGFKYSRYVIILFLTILFMAYPIVKYHPNENVYFNALAGGLSGAYDKKIPSAGNSFGNAYYQAVDWMNENLEKDAKLVFVQGTLTNIPSIYLRPDIKLWNGYWSAIDRKGEYLVELTYEGVKVAYPYAWDYVEKFLIPVYEVKVDGVAIAKVWKNDLVNTNNEYKKIETPFTGKINLTILEDEILVTLSKEAILSHITLNFSKNSKCGLSLAHIFTSNDGKLWIRKGDDFLSHQINAKLALDGEVANYYFAGENTRYIKIKTNDLNSCLLNIKSFSVTILQ